MHGGYSPSDFDILSVRIRTTGIIQYEHLVQVQGAGPLGTSTRQQQITIVDVGGQRCERKKWIQCFDQVKSVIFVAALNHYASLLFEQQTINSMHEALELYERTLSGKWFRVM